MAIPNFCTQRPNTLRGLASAVFIVTALVIAAPVCAQTQQQMNWCTGQDWATPQQRIDGCTAAIKSGSYAGDDLANLLNYRGTAYADKSLYNLAVGDYEQALTLKPDFAAALQNRDNAYVSKKQFEQRKPTTQRKPPQEVAAARAVTGPAPDGESDVPHYDAPAYCDLVASIGGTPSEFMRRACLLQEQSSYDKLKRQWGALSENIRSHCDEVASLMGSSYFLLLACTQQEKDALRENQGSQFRY